MINTKKVLQFYLDCDKIALKIPEKRKYPRPIFDVIWKYEIFLRKAEYFHNNKGFFNKLLFILYRVRLQLLSNKLTISIPLNTFGPGLSIAHYGGIVVNPNARIGKNCRIHECVTIGATNGNKEAAIIGDNCFIGSGAKIIGNIKISNDVAIGAGAVVVKDIDKDGVTVGGIPAKIISQSDSSRNLIKATDIVLLKEEKKYE